jgi:hypothetical protein
MHVVDLQTGPMNDFLRMGNIKIVGRHKGARWRTPSGVPPGWKRASPAPRYGLPRPRSASIRSLASAALIGWPLPCSK